MERMLCILTTGIDPEAPREPLPVQWHTMPGQQQYNRPAQQQQQQQHTLLPWGGSEHLPGPDPLPGEDGGDHQASNTGGRGR